MILWLRFMIIKKILLILFFNTISFSNEKFNDTQIVIMLKEYFKETPNAPTLLGHRFYQNRNNRIIQLEVDADFEDINTSLLFSFKAISLIANLANKEFNRGILILHSKPNNLPVIAETAITCAQQFFIYEKMGEKKWRKDCLSIKHN